MPRRSQKEARSEPAEEKNDVHQTGKDDHKRKHKHEQEDEEERKGNSVDENEAELPTEINPYNVLSIDPKATQDQIKTAYRKAALRHHPDKARDEKDKKQAHMRFQEIAFAYAILSDERRRKRYDTTGSTAESLADDDADFDWLDYFREQTRAMVDSEMIEAVKREYQHSREEQEDILRCYVEGQGDMDAVYEGVMCSNVLDDDARFRGVIDEAIREGRVRAFKKYTGETEARRKKRVKAAKSEEAEAMVLADELGVQSQLFGKDKDGGKDQDALKAIIQSRQKDRASDFLNNLEQKYGATGKNGKRKIDEPPEELFQQNARRSRK